MTKKSYFMEKIAKNPCQPPFPKRNPAPLSPTGKKTLLPSCV
jgi:hypothetical protein